MKRLIRYFMVCAVLLAGWSCTKEEPTPTPPETTFTPKYALGGYLYNDLPENLGQTLFSLLLSDVKLNGTVDEFVGTGVGQVLWLDMFVVTSQKGVLPDGTYNFFIDDGTMDRHDFALSDMSVLQNINADGTLDEEYLGAFKTAKLVVSSANGTQTFAFTGTFTSGTELTCEYTGKVDFIEGKAGNVLPPIERDVDATFIESDAIYYGAAQNGAGYYSISFAEYESSGGFAASGSALSLHLVSAMEDDVMAIAPGTYTVATEFSNNPRTYNAGQIQPGMLDTGKLQDLGTSWTLYLVQGDDFQTSYGPIKSGTVDVAVSGATYTFTINFVDEYGNKLTGKYEGALEIKDKSRYTTLTRDLEVILDDYPCSISYWGQDYLESEGLEVDVWYIEIGTWEDGTEAVQLELWAPHGTFEDKLPAAEYGVSLDWDAEVSPHICLPGRMLNISEMHFSWYMGEFTSGLALANAPIIDGVVLIDPFEDEQTGELAYTISIMAEDDAKDPHNMMIDWEGVPTFKDMTKNNKAPQRISKSRNILLSSNLGGLR